MLTVDSAGSLCFGVVLGWITYRTLRRSQTNGLSDIATVLGVIGGGTVTGLFPKGAAAFSWYAIGLAIGFFAYLIACWFLPDKITVWLGDTVTLPAARPLPPQR